MQTKIKIATVLALSLLAFPLAAQPPEKSYMFQTVLLLGSTEGESDLSGVPHNVVRALDDVMKFLPFSSYRMIDTSIIRSASHARGRFAGPSGQQFELEFGFHQADGKGLFVRGFELTALVPAKQKGLLPEGQNGSAGANHPEGRSEVIATSFTVDVGETIVVGTSKLNGSGQAMIVFFTAMP